MICDFCRDNVLEPGKGRSWDYHHCSPTQFASSAQEGCTFCARLAANLVTRNQSTLDLVDLVDIVERWNSRAAPDEAIYRWSMRKEAGMSEQEECVSITFRSLPANVKDKKSIAERGYLPDETFYLYSERVLPSPQELGGDTAKDQTWTQITTWLTECVQCHPECQKSTSSSSFRPKRLLDLGPIYSSWKKPDFVGLNIAEADRPASVQYVTLSHPWGKNHKFDSLLGDNIDNWSNHGIPWSAIESNKNFEHALEIAWNLGIQYIWIDSLCIIQKNPADWEDQAPQMHAIYRNSYCNIVAADCTCGDDGLFRSRDVDRTAADVYMDRQGRANGLLAGKTWRVVPGGLWRADLLDSPIYKRGWVFQERMLSPRLLHYGKTQVFWDCITTSGCESIPNGLPRQLDDIAQADRHWRGWLHSPEPEAEKWKDLYGFWSHALREYTSNQLTFQSDKLKAVRGIAKVIEDAQKDAWGKYQDGLWANFLLHELAWTVCRTDDPMSPGSTQERNSEFPSWSWASVKGAIKPAGVPVGNLFYMAGNHDGGEVFVQQTPEHGSAIGIRCHVGEVKTRSDPKSSKVHLGLHGFPAAENLVNVHPDAPIHEGGCSNFLLMLVFREPKTIRDDFGHPIRGAAGENPSDDDFVYSGSGLLVDKVANLSDYYTRKGVIKFADLSPAQWKQVQLVLDGYNPELGARIEPSSESAKKIWLK